MSVIEVKALVKTYRSGWILGTTVEALRGASFEVEAGEIFGILGPNGAGKTTIMKVLTGLISATSGSAKIFGKNVGRSAVRAKIGYLPEHHRFPEYLTGLQALDYYGGLSGLSMRQVKARADDVLDLVGMREWQNTKLSNYSKGMNQRFGLAQALVHNPDIVFLDEPTDGVDPVGRAEIRHVLGRLRDEGKTVFLNSHLLQEVELICQRIAIMSHGKVLKTGTVSEITANEPETKIQVSTSLGEGLAEMNQLKDGMVLKETRTFAEDGAEVFEIVIPSQDQEVVNQCLDLIRAKGVFIRSLIPVRVSLEEAFLETVQGERQVGAKNTVPVAKAKGLKAKVINESL